MAEQFLLTGTDTGWLAATEVGVDGTTEYRRIGDQVTVRGKVTPAVSGRIFRVPSAFAPHQKIQFLVSTATSSISAASEVRRLEVASSGYAFSYPPGDQREVEFLVSWLVG